VLAVLAHRRRGLVHFNVSEHPTAAWTAQQVRAAFPEVPRCLISIDPRRATAGSWRWWRFRKLAACIIATNVVRPNGNAVERWVSPTTKRVTLQKLAKVCP